jgi:hypothetical protein
MTFPKCPYGHSVSAEYSSPLTQVILHCYTYLQWFYTYVIFPLAECFKKGDAGEFIAFLPFIFK